MLEAPIQVDEAREAAVGRFFNAQNLIQSYEFFKAIYGDLLGAENVGVIMQAGKTEEGELVPLDDDEKEGEIDKLISIILDTRHYSAGELSWQLTEADFVRFPNEKTEGSKGRVVRQLKLTPTGLQATRFTFFVNGRLRDKTADDAQGLAEYLETLIGDKVEHAYLKKTVEKQERAHRELGKLSVAGIKYSEELYNKKISQKEKQVSQAGFAPLVPFVPPPQDRLTLPPKDALALEPFPYPVFVSQVRYPAPKMPEPVGEQLALLPDNDFDFDAVADLGSVVVDRKTARQLKRTAQTYLSRYELREGDMSELPARKAIEKTLALGALKKTILPLVNHWSASIFPDGLFKLNERFYRHDTTGLYVVGSDTMNRSGQAYRTLVPFEQPIRHSPARNEDWADLFADVLAVMKKEKWAFFRKNDAQV